MNKDQVQKYLARIEWKGKWPEHTLNSLKRLMKAQLTHIPYENIDVYDLEQVPDLKETVLFHKIIENHRGGYCFEVNGLFYQLLISLGYPVYPVGIRVMWNKTVFQPALHMGMVVQLNQQKYLCDVGYGGPGPKEPLPLKEQEICTGDKRFQVSRKPNSNTLCRHNQPFPEAGLYRDDGADYLICVMTEDKWRPVMQFTDTPFCETDYETMNFYCAKSPELKFGRVRIINLSTENGSVSMLNHELTIKNNGQTEVYHYDTAESISRILWGKFGILFPADKLKI